MPEYLQELEQALLSNCPALLHEWLPGGVARGRYYYCANLYGGKGESLKVEISGHKAGRWGDYAGKKGDSGGNLVSLYAATHGLGGSQDGWREAFNVLCEKYGIQRKKRERVAYQVITPIPDSACEFGADGSPILPSIFLTRESVAYWTYFDRDGNFLCFRFRINKAEKTSTGKLGKDVLPLTWCRNPTTGEESWQIRELPDPLPLYNLMALTSNPDKILIVQGEKKALSAMRLLPDWTPTTQPGGDKKVAKTDWSAIIINSGARVVIWPDNDDSGRTAAAEVGSILNRPYEVVRADPSWEKGCDLSDLEIGGWDTVRIESYWRDNLVKVTPEAPKVRPEVPIIGKDPNPQMQSVYEAIREMKADIYSFNDLVSTIRRNAYGIPVISSMDGRDFRSWAAKELFTYNMNYSSGFPGVKEYRAISEDLGNHIIFNSHGELPLLKRFSEIPVFSQSGELIDKQGYHAASQTYVSVPHGYDSEMPLEDAYGLIDDLLDDFPFEDKAGDKTAAIAFVLTHILRDLITGPTPMFRFEAPSPGTGKSLLCEALSEIITQFPQEFTLPEENDEELKKLITSSLMKFPSLVVFDNVEKFVSPVFESTLTKPFWSERILGGNKTFVCPIRNLWAVTLNNPTLSIALLRRSVRIRLNAKMEKPYTREESKFRHHPLMRYIRKNRGVLVSAFVAVAKAGINHTTSNIPALGSFESWSSVLAPVLEFSSYAGFLDGREEDYKTSSDSKEQGLHEFIEAWKEKFGSRPVTTSELAEVAMGISDLPVYRGKDGRVNIRSLSNLLRNNRDRVISDATIGKAEHSRNGIVVRLIGKFEAKWETDERLPYSDNDEKF